MGSWHVTGDRSNAGGVVGSVAAPGTGDEVFLAAQEAAQAHRDSQGRLSGFMFHLPPAPRNNRHSHNLLQSSESIVTELFASLIQCKFKQIYGHVK